MSVSLDLIQARIGEWLDLLNKLGDDESGYVYTYTAVRLNKYTKIVSTYRDGSRSVHAFVDPLTGDVYKAAGWKAPAKGVRFNLADDDSFADMMLRVDRHGSYLYMDRG